MSEKPLEPELTALLNKHSAENDSNTPDFILASYLLDVLHAYNETVRRRDQWHNGPQE